MSFKEFLRKSQFILMLALGIYPVGACIIIFIAPELLDYMWLLPAFYGAVCLLSFAVPAKLRLWLGILGAVTMVLPCMQLANVNARNIMLALAAAHGALLLWSMGIPGWENTRELSLSWLGGCLAALLTGYLLASYEPRLASVTTGLRISVFVFVFFAMLSLNRGSLSLASGGQRGFSAPMRRKNVLLTVGMFSIAFCVALIPSLMNLVTRLFELLGSLIQKIAELFPEELVAETQATTETTEAAATGEGMGVLTENMPSKRTSPMVYIIMAVVSVGFIVPVAIAAIYKLGKALWRGVHNLVDNIVSAAGTQTEEFHDEITDTRSDGESEYHRQKEKKQRGIALGKMTPAEQIRYRYRRLRVKHPEWKDHSTARENLPETAAGIYERVRYSDHPVTEQDAEAFRVNSKPKPINLWDLDE